MSNSMMRKTEKNSDVELETICNGDRIIYEILKQKEKKDVHYGDGWGDAWGPME